MDVACSTLGFTHEPLEQCLRHIAELDFQKVDLAIGDDNPQLSPTEVIADPGLIIRRIRQGPTIGIAAVTLATRATGSELVAVVDAVAHFCKQVASPVLSLRAPAAGGTIEEAAAVLGSMCKAVLLHGCALSVTTEVGALTELADVAVKLCELTPGLGLTLDPSHLVYGPNRDADYDALFPYVKHTQLRDSGKTADQPQLRVGRGEVEYGKIITALAASNYKGALTVAFDRAVPHDFELEPEIRKLRLLLESLL